MTTPPDALSPKRVVGVIRAEVVRSTAASSATRRASRSARRSLAGAPTRRCLKDVSVALRGASLSSWTSDARNGARAIRG